MMEVDYFLSTLVVYIQIEHILSHSFLFLGGVFYFFHFLLAYIHYTGDSLCQFPIALHCTLDRLPPAERTDIHETPSMNKFPLSVVVLR
jgi:hypothetical protein